MWFAFKENFDRRVALGMLAIVAGAAVLGWPGEAGFTAFWPTVAVLGACFAWGIDNNLTRKVSLTDATWIASVKGLVSGVINLALAFALGATLPAIPIVAGAMPDGLRKTIKMPHRLRWGGMSDLGGGLDAHAKMQLNLFWVFRF